jgi:hypothetical protein
MGVAGSPVERRRPVVAASLLVLVGAAVIVAGIGTSDDPEPEARSGPARIQGLEAELIDRRQKLEAGEVAWQTRWRLCWRSQNGVRDYLLTIVTSEGVDPTERSSRTPCYSFTVASGTATAGDVRDQRNAQLDLVESNLSVSVAARTRDGRIGPPSPDIPVGYRRRDLRR